VQWRCRRTQHTVLRLTCGGVLSDHLHHLEARSTISGICKFHVLAGMRLSLRKNL
jgi:hypothetical protein